MMLGNRIQREEPALSPVEIPAVQGSGLTNAYYGTSHTITMPSSISVGDFLLCAFRSSGAWIGSTTPSDWTQLLDAEHDMAIYYKVAEGGDTLSLTTDSLATGSAITYRISNANSCNATSDCSSNSTIDFPSNTATPIAGPYTNFLICGSDGGVITGASLPTGYGDVIATSSSNSRVSSIHKEDSSRVEDPAVFDLSASTNYCMANVAVYHTT